jgi:hypothetical protein
MSGPRLSSAAAAEWLLRLFFWRLLWPTHGLELVLGPRPYLLDQCEGCGPVESRRLVALVAELNRPGGEHVGL